MSATQTQELELSGIVIPSNELPGPDLERQQHNEHTEKTVPIIGVLCSFVEQTGPTLQEGKFVDVSIPLFGLAWSFLPDRSELREGLILVGLARCIAMSGLAVGDDKYCAILVASSTLVISYASAATSVAVFPGIPLGAAVLTRFTLRKLIGPTWSEFIIIFFFTLLFTYRLGFGFKLRATQSFTAVSNNFELAIAVAVATFGPNSDQALVTTVGPLIQVPVLIGSVYLVRWIGDRWAWKR
ncbi:hypothetical protein EJ02DRAFT_505511 [Clathrospora elynae]|uniref:SBF-domain-containing protein n=1 Tax=Clathrospora elynae TaxID=706981 RepID=A0A6A5SFQ7_9PLEO|nr:hypothetical protein EJ02DRAFT_505511 [Clathrospora elynae]